MSVGCSLWFPGKTSKVRGESVSVKEQTHLNDWTVPVLLAYSVFLKFAFLVHLKEEVGAVIVEYRCIASFLSLFVKERLYVAGFPVYDIKGSVYVMKRKIRSLKQGVQIFEEGDSIRAQISPDRISERLYLKS